MEISAELIKQIALLLGGLGGGGLVINSIKNWIASKINEDKERIKQLETFATKIQTDKDKELEEARLTITTQQKTIVELTVNVTRNEEIAKRLEENLKEAIARLNEATSDYKQIKEDLEATQKTLVKREFQIKTLGGEISENF